MKIDYEPLYEYYTRIFFIGILMTALMLVLVFLIAMSALFSFIITEKYAGKGEQDDSALEIAMRNGRLMAMMQAIPYSSFLISQVRDCPICLETFNRDSLVV